MLVAMEHRAVFDWKQPNHSPEWKPFEQGQYALEYVPQPATPTTTTTTEPAPPPVAPPPAPTEPPVTTVAPPPPTEPPPPPPAVPGPVP